jgi:hypothetical protein
MLKLIANNHCLFDPNNFPLDLEENRKKSLNTLLAEATIRELFEKVKKINSDLINEFDIFFCTGEGELTKTIEFYQAWTEQNRARPIIFQNSLHNSTLGALSLTFPGVAQGFTISSGDTSAEMGIDAALAMSSKNPIIILGLDIYLPEIKLIKESFYQNKVELVSGACAGLFIPSSHPLFQTLNGPIIKDIKIIHNKHNDTFLHHYPANGLEKICKMMEINSSFTLTRPHHHEVIVTCHES